MTDVGRFGIGDLGDLECRLYGRSEWYQVVFQPGLWGATSASSGLVNGGIIRAWPFFFPMTKLIDTFVWLQTALGASTFMRFGIYRNKLGDIYPDALLWASIEYDLASVGVYYKDEVISPVLRLRGPALYWFVSHKGGNNAAYGTMPGITSHVPTYRKTLTYGVLPDPFPAEATLGAEYPAAAWFHLS